jgi:CubicO group peptidase (beta-lactamase class C family)
MTDAAPGVIPMQGFISPQFAELGDVFARLIADARSGTGAAVAIYWHGELVVDLTAGEYLTNSLQLIFSVSKSVTAIAAGILESEGLLDLDQPLGSFWPEMAKASTAKVTTRMVLAHRSGLAAIDRILTLEDLVAGRDVQAVEVQDPYWEPGTAHGYHAFTFGTLLQQIFLRRLGKTVGDVVAQRITEPLGLDLWMSAPDSVAPRIKPVQFAPPRITPGREESARRTSIPAGSTSQLARHMDIYNSPELRRLGVPSSSGIAGARDLAKLFAATLAPIDGIRLLDSNARSRLIAQRSSGIDRVLGVRTTFGSGVQLPFPQFGMLSKSSYGHEASGGTIAFADVDADLAFGFTTNMHPVNGGAATSALALLPAIRSILDDTEIEHSQEAPQ